MNLYQIEDGVLYILTYGVHTKCWSKSEVVKRELITCKSIFVKGLFQAI